MTTKKGLEQFLCNLAHTFQKYFFPQAKFPSVRKEYPSPNFTMGKAFVHRSRVKGGIGHKFSYVKNFPLLALEFNEHL